MPIDLSQFTTAPDKIKPSEGGFERPEDGRYEYEITKIGIHEGQKGKSIYIDYRLDNGQSFRDWFGLPAVYGQETEKERQAIGRYLKRLIELGVAPEIVNTFSDTDSLVGWRGTFELVTTKGKTGTSYQNIRNLRPSQGASSAPQQPAAAPVQQTQPTTQQPGVSDGSNPFATQ